MNDADNEVCDTYVENRDEMSDQYLRDLLHDIMLELEDREDMPETIPGHE